MHSSRTCPLLATALLLGCTPDDERPPADEPSDSGLSDSAPGDSATQDSDPGEPVPCGLVTGIAWQGEAIPGTEIGLGAVDGDSGLDYALSWTVSAGELGKATAAQTMLQLPMELAVYEAELVQVDLAVVAGGCIDEAHSLQLEVDHPLAQRVLVISNPATDRSEEVAQAYADLHQVPDAQLCAVETADQTTLDTEEYASFAAAVQGCIDAIGPHLHYLVPVYGVPYKVSGQIEDIGTGGSATVSLDALLFMGQESTAYTAAIYNPLWREGDSMAGDYQAYAPFGQLRREIEDQYGLATYLVARLDGADADAALALMDRAAQAQELADQGALAGTVYVDGRYGDSEPAKDEFGSYESGEWNMWGTRRIFEQLGLYDVVWDGNDAEFGTEPAPVSCPDALYYAGWYSYHNYNDAFSWAPGAIGGHLDSCSACDFRQDGSWAAGALRRGITATFGAVGEPYVAGMPEYDQFFLYLLQGATYGEAAYQSTRVGLWMMLWLGDPLYRPYAEPVWPQ